MRLCDLMIFNEAYSDLKHAETRLSLAYDDMFGHGVAARRAWPCPACSSVCYLHSYQVVRAVTTHEPSNAEKA